MTSDEFNQQYNSLLSTHNYRGLAQLLRNSQFDDDEIRDRAYNMADRYEEQADISDALLQGATYSQKAAYNFIANGPIKSKDPNIETDEYSKSFSEAWNSLADDNNNINIKFATEKEYNNFVSNMGGSIEDIVRSGIKLNSDYNISIPTDYGDQVKIYKAIENSGIIDRINQTAYQSMYEEPGIQHSKTLSYSVLNPADRILINGLNKMRTTVEKANEEYNSLMDKVTPYVLQTVVTGYMGEDDKQLQQAFANGAMDLQTFKEARKLLEEKYNRVLQTKSLSQYNVYTMNEDNEGSEILQKLEDNILKSQLDEEINLAMTEGRLHFSHASNGVMYGTMITIDQRQDSKKHPMEEYPARRFFVQDLFKSEAENSLRQDTQVDAQLQYAKHQTYKHTYRAKDGGLLEDWDNTYDTATYTDEFGNKRRVSKAEALNIMDDDIIAKRLINYYKKANTVNKSNNTYTEESYQVYGGNGYDYDTLINNIKQKSLQVTAAKYGNPNSEYVKVKANKLASTIIKMVVKDLEL